MRVVVIVGVAVLLALFLLWLIGISGREDETDEPKKQYPETTFVEWTTPPPPPPRERVEETTVVQYLPKTGGGD